MLSQDLDFKPGNRYAYSNFGYCLLGRLIEAVTDQTYEQYVQTHVLKPLDIHSMRIACTHLDQRFANEVRYVISPLSRLGVFRQYRPKSPFPIWRLVPGSNGLAWRLDCICRGSGQARCRV